MGQILLTQSVISMETFLENNDLPANSTFILLKQTNYNFEICSLIQIIDCVHVYTFTMD